MVNPVKIGGVETFSTVDFPDKIAAVVFMKGCPWRCPFCHNAFLQDASAADNFVWEKFVEFLKTRRGILDGVVFSGGEPLMQGEFLLEVLEQIPEMHTCIETSGYAQKDLFDRVTERLDYIIMDLKLMDSEAHRAYTGVDNGPILENARRLCRGNTPFTIRVPLIPGVNDTEQNLRQTARWIAGAKKLEKVELLPYHKTAGAKYAMLGREYRPGFDVERPVHAAAEIFMEYGIRSKVL